MPCLRFFPLAARTRATTRLLLGVIAASAACTDAPGPRGDGFGATRGERDALRSAGDPAVRRATRARRTDRAPGLLPVLLRSERPGATKREIERWGGSVDTIARHILTARVPAELVGDLELLPFVGAVEAARAVRPRLDRVREEIGIDRVLRGEPPVRSPRTGRGVVVGIADRGIDLTHPAFLDAKGISRVIALWDQASFTGSPPPSRGYGSYCSGEELRAGECVHGAGAGSPHGTHVAGIAAGGPVAGQPYSGVAPDVDIVFVNLGTTVHGGSFKDAVSASVCDAVAFVFDVAAERGAPAVVNMSFGTQADPHDGTSLANECLDSLAAPGRILVASAGNEGQPVQIGAGLDAYPHAHGVARPDGPAQLGLFAVQDDAAQSLLYGDARAAGVPAQLGAASLYFDAGLDLAVEVGVLDGGVVAWSSRAVRAGTPDLEEQLPGADGTLGPYWVACGEVRPRGARLCEVGITDADLDGAELTREVLVRVSGDGAFDGFIDHPNGAGFAQAIAGTTLDTRMTVGYPASSRQVLAVASYVSRDAWTDSRGIVHERLDRATGAQVVLGSLSVFSSRGPARDPALTGPCPDIAAPGEVVISALHRALAGVNDEVVVESPGGYFALSGTSMASAVVTGVVAAMLEANPSLSVEDVREILADTARAPAGTTVPDEGWGLGMIDAASAVSAAEARASHAAAGAAGREPGGMAGAHGGAAPGTRLLRDDDEGCSCRVAGSRGSGRPRRAVFSVLALVALASSRASRRARVTRSRTT